jgi:starvation-inducible DNA-binding protein
MGTQNQLFLPQDKAEKITDPLNDLLANTQVFYMNVRGYHWNIKGKNFFVLHEKFEELYDGLAEQVDEIAERILMPGGRPVHGFTSYLKMSQIKEDTNNTQAETTLKGTVEGLQTLLPRESEILEAAGDAGDEGTIDQISGYLGEQEKLVWMYAAFNK